MVVWSVSWWWFCALSVFSQEPGCALFAALCKEDLIYSQPMNQLTLDMSFLNLNPKKLYFVSSSDWAGHWHYQFDSYQTKLKASECGSHLCWKCKVLDSIWHSPARKRLKRHVLPRCRRPPRLKTLRWLHGGLRTSGTEDLPFRPDDRLRVGLGFRRTWLVYIQATRNPCSCGTGWTERIVQIRLWNMTKHKHGSYMSHRF